MVDQVFYDEMAEVAVELLEEFGVPWTVDPRPGSAAAQFTANGVKIEEVQNLFGQSGVDLGDWYMIFEAGKGTFEMGQHITRNGVTRAVKKFEEIKTADTVIAVYVWTSMG